MSSALDFAPQLSSRIAMAEAELTEAELLLLLRSASEALDQARNRRDRWIRLAKASGISIPQIVEASGLKRARIYQLVGEAARRT
jgi:hypothetical protein